MYASHHDSSQPTYEELKGVHAVYRPRFPLGSQPTYEELKGEQARGKSWGVKSSQPTYEELKVWYPQRHHASRVVLSLPMRN